MPNPMRCDQLHNNSSALISRIWRPVTTKWYSAHCTHMMHNNCWISFHRGSRFPNSSGACVRIV